MGGYRNLRTLYAPMERKGLQLGRGSARGRQGYADGKDIRLNRGRTLVLSICGKFIGGRK